MFSCAPPIRTLKLLFSNFMQPQQLAGFGVAEALMFFQQPKQGLFGGCVHKGYGRKGMDLPLHKVPHSAEMWLYHHP